MFNSNDCVQLIILYYNTPIHTGHKDLLSTYKMVTTSTFKLFIQSKGKTNIPESGIYYHDACEYSRYVAILEESNGKYSIYDNKLWKCNALRLTLEREQPYWVHKQSWIDATEFINYLNTFINQHGIDDKHEIVRLKQDLEKVSVKGRLKLDDPISITASTETMRYESYRLYAMTKDKMVPNVTVSKDYTIKDNTVEMGICGYHNGNYYIKQKLLELTTDDVFVVDKQWTIVPKKNLPQIVAVFEAHTNDEDKSDLYNDVDKYLGFIHIMCNAYYDMDVLENLPKSFKNIAAPNDVYKDNQVVYQSKIIDNYNKSIANTMQCLKDIIKIMNEDPHRVDPNDIVKLHKLSKDVRIIAESLETTNDLNKAFNKMWCKKDTFTLEDVDIIERLKRVGFNPSKKCVVKIRFTDKINGGIKKIHEIIIVDTKSTGNVSNDSFDAMMFNIASIKVDKDTLSNNYTPNMLYRNTARYFNAYIIGHNFNYVVYVDKEIEDPSKYHECYTHTFKESDTIVPMSEQTRNLLNMYTHTFMLTGKGTYRYVLGNIEDTCVVREETDDNKVHKLVTKFAIADCNDKTN